MHTRISTRVHNGYTRESVNHKVGQTEKRARWCNWTIPLTISIRLSWILLRVVLSLLLIRPSPEDSYCGKQQNRHREEQTCFYKSHNQNTDTYTVSVNPTAPDCTRYHFPGIFTSNKQFPQASWLVFINREYIVHQERRMKTLLWSFACNVLQMQKWMQVKVF